MNLLTDSPIPKSTDELLELLKESHKSMNKFLNYYKKLEPKSKEFLVCQNTFVLILKLCMIIQDIVSSSVTKEFENTFNVKAPETLY